VLLNERKHLAFLVCQVIQHDSRQQLDECRQLTAAAQRGVHARERGRDMPVLLHHGVDRCQAPGSESSARSTGHRSSSSAE